MSNKKLQNFHLTVKALIVINGSLLLVSSSDPERLNDFECPGGRLEMGETVIETMYREVVEEVGLDFSKITHTCTLYNYNQRPVSDYQWDDSTEILELYFLLSSKENDLPEIKLAEENTQHKWVSTLQELQKLSFRNQNQKDIFESILKNIDKE